VQAVQKFHVYILKCADGSFYTGHTDNLEARLQVHSEAPARAFTSTRLPVILAWDQEFTTRDEALTAERQIKGWSRAKKEALIRRDWGEISRLSHAHAPVPHAQALYDDPSFDRLRTNGLESLRMSRVGAMASPDRSFDRLRTNGGDIRRPDGLAAGRATTNEPAAGI
jgi:predicted GIY-YIG superfamily endonuclease